MNFRRRRLPAVLTALALCGALSSCGGSSEGTATSTSASVAIPTSTDAGGTESADEAPAATLPTTAPAPPVTTSPVTVPPPPSVAATVPATTVDPSQVDETISEFDGMLLAGEDVGPGWETSEISAYSASSAMDAESCPAVVSINEVDRYLVTQVEILDQNFNAVNSAIGRASSAEVATEIVNQFSEIHTCDTTDLFGTGDATGGLIDVPGATAASVLRLTSEQGEFVELAIASVNDLVVVIGVFWDDTADLSGLVGQLAATAVEKLAA